MIKKFIIFCLVGATAALVDLGVFNILFYFNVYFILSRILAISAAWTYVFIVNRTFKNAKKLAAKFGGTAISWENLNEAQRNGKDSVFVSNYDRPDFRLKDLEILKNWKTIEDLRKVVLKALEVARKEGKFWMSIYRN